MNPSKAHLISLSIAACGLLAGCIAKPYDGETIASHPTTIIPRMEGWGTSPGQPVKILAKNASGAFVEVTSTTTQATGWNWDGTTWYSWHIDNYNLPAAYWTDKPGGCGKKATIRAKIGNYNGYSLDQPHVDCWNISQTTNEFIEACVSDDSPDVKIDTCGALCC